MHVLEDKHGYPQGKHYNAPASVCHILSAESELSDSVCVCHSTVPQSHTLVAMIGRRAGSRCVPIQMNDILVSEGVIHWMTFRDD